MKNIQFGCKLISLLIFLTLITNWENILILFRLAFQQPNINAWSLLVISLVSLFLIFNLTAIVGMFLTRRWGFITTYIAIIFSTIFFSTSYLPFVMKLFPVDVRFVSLIVINLIILLYVIYLDIISRKKLTSQ